MAGARAGHRERVDHRLIDIKEKLERAHRLALETIFMVDLQCRRVLSKSNRDWWFDLQFLIIALRRLRAAACIARDDRDVRAAVKLFDRTLPHLALMRHVGEHVDAYGVDRGRLSDVDGSKLQEGELDGTTFRWLGGDLDIALALNASGKLYGAVKTTYYTRRDGDPLRK